GEPEKVIDPNKTARYHRATHLVSKRRPFVRHELRVDGLNEPNALYARLEDYCQREAYKHQDGSLRPLVQIQLIGTLNFDAGSLDLPHMEELVTNNFRNIYVRFDKNNKDMEYITAGVELDATDSSASSD